MIEGFIKSLEGLSLDEKITLINKALRAIQAAHPLAAMPVTCVQWVKTEELRRNDYNPNAVAPPEMALLERSIAEDGYTQPVVAWESPEGLEIVDGFHRSRVGTESARVREATHGYLPVVVVNTGNTARENRMASTIRHNRARGAHSVDLMKAIVTELVEAGMGDHWIMRHIGMDADELLRLKQITGLAALFANGEFTSAEVDVSP